MSMLEIYFSATHLFISLHNKQLNLYTFSMQMGDRCPSDTHKHTHAHTPLRLQNDGCSRAGRRLMTRLCYNTQLCTGLILCMHRDRTLHTQMPPCLIPQESVKFDYCDFYKHTPYESRRSIHQDE